MRHCSCTKCIFSVTLHLFVEENGISFRKWDSNRANIPTISQNRIFKIIDSVKASIELNPNQARIYKGLFFAKLFYAYAEKKKGDVALSILVDEELMGELKVPPYIREGIAWLSI